MKRDLDLITIGRSSVDLYGAQIGGRLEDMGSFEKYIGGSPTNMAAGTARLGLRSALITRVGDEHMGRFIREELEREGVDTTCVITDPERLTALVLLGIRDSNRFPLIFYRSDCADMALCDGDIDPEFIARARCVTVTGTHLSHPRTESAVIKALELARASGARTALDIDYRPNLWGLSGHGDGENRYIESAQVTEKLQSTLHLFDLIVGTEEEFHIVGGSADTVEALRTVRLKSGATLVCKRGPMGAAAFPGAVPDTLDQGVSGPGFPIEVHNVLGAGDGFMSGLLKGWLTDRGWRTALTYANACGALAVSRHGCTPAYPSWDELRFFLRRGVRVRALRDDAELEHVHWATNRRRDWPSLRVFAFDHIRTFEGIDGAGQERIGRFRELCVEAALRVASGRLGYGIFCDGRFGRDALYAAAGSGLWIGRSSMELPAYGPETSAVSACIDCGGLDEWPLEHVVRFRWRIGGRRDGMMEGSSEWRLQQVFAAARRHRLEFMLELDGPGGERVSDGNLVEIIARCGEIGVRPDWLLLAPPATGQVWSDVCDTILENDPYVRGVLISGHHSPHDGPGAEVVGHDLVKGFVAGERIFGQAAHAWMGGALDDAGAVGEMALAFGKLCRDWDRLRTSSREKAA